MAKKRPPVIASEAIFTPLLRRLLRFARNDSNWQCGNLIGSRFKLNTNDAPHGAPGDLAHLQ
jgi:hypothetical protein